MSEICLDRYVFITYVFLLFILIGILLYTIYYMQLNKIPQQINRVYTEKPPSKIYSQHFMDKYIPDLMNTNIKFLDKVYNPLTSPDNTLPNPTFNSLGYDAYQNYQMIGYITNNINQYPIYGKYHYPNKSDRWDYYTINNQIKIPIYTKNYQELYDGDTVIIPELNNDTFTFKKYNNSIQYNPNII